MEDTMGDRRQMMKHYLDALAKRARRVTGPPW